MRRGVATLALITLVSAVDPSKALHAVVDTMQDLLVTIENEEKAETENFDCFMEWCTKEQVEKRKEIEEQGLLVQDLRVTTDQAESEISKNSYVVQENLKDIKDINVGLETAKAIREEEQSKYDADRAINVQSVKQLATAIAIVDGTQGENFLQQRSKEKGQEYNPGEASYLVGTFKSLKENMERNQASADAEEKRRKEVFEKLMRTKKTLLRNLTGETENKQILIAEVSQELTQAKNDIRTTNSGRKEGQLYLEKTERSCELRKKNWEDRQVDRSKEKIAIQEAISFLTIIFQEEMPILEQEKPQLDTKKSASSDEKAADAVVALANDATDAVDGADDAGNEGDDATDADDGTDDGADDDETIDAPVKPHSFLQIAQVTGAKAAPNFLTWASSELESEKKSLNLSTMSSLVTRASQKRDQFGGIKEKILTLVSTLERVQKEEITKEKRCVAKKKEHATTLAEKKDYMMRLRSLIDRKTELIRTATGGILEIKTFMMESKKENEELQKLRKQERLVFEKGEKERRLALKVLFQTKHVLTTFYESKNKPALAGKGAKSESQRHDEKAKVILAMVDKIAEDVKKESSDAQIAEKKAQEDFEQQEREAVEEFDSRMERITELSARRANASVQLDNTKDDAESLKDKVDAIEGKIKALVEECGVFLHTFNERQKARSFEISQLRDAHDIMSGANEAVRTGVN